MNRSSVPAPAAALMLAVAGILAAPPAPADPPSHAPAHGWRKKHDPTYAGYSGRKWDADYGVVSGRCNREAVGAVLGGVVGGVVGSQVGGGDGRKIATVLGAVVGAAIGAKIGRDMDAADRACVAHSLELAGPGRKVTWNNPQTGVTYLLSPTRDHQRDGRTCRDYTLTLTSAGKQTVQNGTACRSGPGAWQVAG